MFELNELCAIFNVYYFQYEHRPNGEKPEKKSKSKKSKKDKDSDAEEDVVAAATTPKSPNKETTGSSSSSSSKRKQASNKKGEDGQQSQSLLEEQQDEVTGYSAERKGWVVLVGSKELIRVIWSINLRIFVLFVALQLRERVRGRVGGLESFVVDDGQGLWNGRLAWRGHVLKEMHS